MKRVLSAMTLLALAGPAHAHATLEQTTATVGAWTKITLRVPHGCDGQPTHTVRLTLPAGFYAAKPMPKPGWQLETKTGPYAAPYSSHGTLMTKGLREVAWTGGSLPDGWYDEFTVTGTFGPDLKPGTRVHFAALQECEDGTADWTNTSGSGDHPAPALTLVSGEASGHGHGAGQHETDHAAQSGHATMDAVTPAANVTKQGDLLLQNPFARATLPNAPVGGGFLTITNRGTTDDRLLSAAIAEDVADDAQIHQMWLEGDVVHMTQLSDGLPIPAGETVVLTPGGYHLMVMGIKQPLVEGQTVDITLTFENAGTVTLPFAISAMNARAGSHMSHDHETSE